MVDMVSAITMNSSARLIRGQPSSRARTISGTVSSTAAEATSTCAAEVIPLVAARLPGLTEADWLQGLREGQAHANAHGLTGVLDARITEQERRIYARGEAEGLLTLRVAGTALVTEADTPETAVARLLAWRAAHWPPRA